MFRNPSKLTPLALVALLVGCESSVAAPEALNPPVDGLTAALAPGDGPEHADVMNQGGAGVYAGNGAKLIRQPNGLRMSLKMPLPAPGTYVYAPGTQPGHPEVFTLWAFVFNHPENCSDPCSGDDLGTATGANGGAYNVGGVIAAGNTINVAGRIGVGEAPFAFESLELPETAEVHLALAPHGAMDPSTLPNELRVPVGSPACGCWWVAIFD